MKVTGGNPFLLAELLNEAAARGLAPTASAAEDVGGVVPRGVANAVLIRVARLAPPAAGLARALSVLGDGAQVGDAGRLAGLTGTDVDEAMVALVSAGVVESGGTIRFTHPIVRKAIYDDIPPAERERLHHSAWCTLQERRAPLRQVAATLAMDEVTCLRSASRAIDLAHRALAAGLPHEPHRGESWVLLALAALAASDALDDALRGVDEILAQARARGSALTVVTVSSLRAIIELRAGDLMACQADAQTAIDLAPELFGAEFAGLAVAAAVLAGLDRDEAPDSLRRLIDGAGVRYDTELMPNAPLRYASGVLRAAGGGRQPRSCDRGVAQLRL